MIGLRRHPPYRALSEFSDGTLEPRGLERVSRHLEHCSVCRGEVGLIRDADQAMRLVPVPPMPEGILERVHERRGSDIRTLLPATGRAGPGRWHPTPGLVIGIVVIGGAIAVGAFSRKADAGASSLEIEAVPAITSLKMSYQPGAALAPESNVTVRARIWRDGAQVPEIRTVGTLSRSGDAFEGEAMLPADAAFALIAVEDVAGEHVDVNGGDFWEYVQDGPVGPTRAAQVARLHALDALADERLVRPAEARIAAVAAAQAAREDIYLWLHRAALELRVGMDAARRAEILALHRQKLTELAPNAESPEDLATLVEYAEILAEPEASARFLRRLERLAPDHDQVLRERFFRVLAEPDASGHVSFGELEALWRSHRWDRTRSSETVWTMASVALTQGLAEGDPRLIERWARRYYQLDESSRDGIVEELSDLEGLDALAIELARERLEHYESLADDARPLHQSRKEFEAVLAGTRARLLAALGKALLASGEAAEGRAKLGQSLDLAWDPSTARELFDALVADDAESPWSRRRLATFVDADPLGAESRPSAVVPSDSEIERAREELIELLLRNAPSGDVPAAAFRSRVGREVPIDDGNVTVIALWHVVPGPNHQEYRKLEDVMPRLTEAGVRVLFAVPEPSLDDAVAFAADTGARPVVDDAGIAAEGFGNWYAQAYVVVHEGWYSVHYDFEKAARLALLRSEARRPVP